MTDYRQKCLSENQEKCEICDSERNIVVHHIDGDKTNDDIENLVPLCHSCHNEVHNGNGPAEFLDELEGVAESEKKVPTTVRLRPSTLDVLDEIAEEQGRTRGELIRSVITAYIDDDPKQIEGGGSEFLTELVRNQQEIILQLSKR